MKLLAKYNRVNLLTTIIVMLKTGIIYYMAINWILTNKIDKDLAVEENEVFEYVNVNQELPQVFESKDLQITFKDTVPGSIKRCFINTVYRRIEEKDDSQEEKRRHK